MLFYHKKILEDIKEFYPENANSSDFLFLPTIYIMKIRKNNFRVMEKVLEIIGWFTVPYLMIIIYLMEN